jgi:hypothetical protein
LVLAFSDSGSSRAERKPRKKKRGESSLSLGIAMIPFGGDSSDGTNRCKQVSLHEVSLLAQDKKVATPQFIDGSLAEIQGTVQASSLTFLDVGGECGCRTRNPANSRSKRAGFLHSPPTSYSVYLLASIVFRYPEGHSWTGDPLFKKVQWSGPRRTDSL